MAAIHEPPRCHTSSSTFDRSMTPPAHKPYPRDMKPRYHPYTGKRAYGASLPPKHHRSDYQTHKRLNYEIKTIKSEERPTPGIHRNGSSTAWVIQHESQGDLIYPNPLQDEVPWRQPEVAVHDSGVDTQVAPASFIKSQTIRHGPQKVSKVNETHGRIELPHQVRDTTNLVPSPPRSASLNSLENLKKFKLQLESKKGATPGLTLNDTNASSLAKLAETFLSKRQTPHAPEPHIGDDKSAIIQSITRTQSAPTPLTGNHKGSSISTDSTLEPGEVIEQNPLCETSLKSSQQAPPAGPNRYPSLQKEPCGRVPLRHDARHSVRHVDREAAGDFEKPDVANVHTNSQGTEEPQNEASQSRDLPSRISPRNTADKESPTTAYTQSPGRRYGQYPREEKRRGSSNFMTRSGRFAVRNGVNESDTHFKKARRLSDARLLRRDDDEVVKARSMSPRKRYHQSREDVRGVQGSPQRQSSKQFRYEIKGNPRKDDSLPSGGRRDGAALLSRIDCSPKTKPSDTHGEDQSSSHGRRQMVVKQESPSECLRGSPWRASFLESPFASRNHSSSVQRGYRSPFTPFHPSSHTQQYHPGREGVDGNKQQDIVNTLQALKSQIAVLEAQLPTSAGSGNPDRPVPRVTRLSNGESSNSYSAQGGRMANSYQNHPRPQSKLSAQREGKADPYPPRRSNLEHEDFGREYDPPRSPFQRVRPSKDNSRHPNEDDHRTHKRGYSTSSNSYVAFGRPGDHDGRVRHDQGRFPSYRPHGPRGKSHENSNDMDKVDDSSGGWRHRAHDPSRGSSSSAQWKNDKGTKARGGAPIRGGVGSGRGRGRANWRN